MVELWTLTPSVVVRIHSPDPKSKKIIIYITHIRKNGSHEKTGVGHIYQNHLIFCHKPQGYWPPCSLSASSAAANMPIWPIIAMTLWNGTNSPT